MRYRSPILAAAALCAALLLSSGPSWALSIGVSINIAPPVLPVYTQPPLPGPGYLWVPGYWAWGDGDYYWVPGTWIEPPQPGLLWTPGYWGWSDGAYLWHEGYWGAQVGFYGGVNYGFGYGGAGYGGGYWSHGAFFYNRSVNRIPGSVHITNVYNRTVIINNNTHVSFNGGQGGIQARPNAAQLAAGRAPHVSPIAAQRQQEQLASRNPGLRAAANHGRPSITATTRPGQFNARGAVTTHTTTHTTHGNGNANSPARGNVHVPERQPGHASPAAHPEAAAPRPEAAARPEGAPRANGAPHAGPQAHAAGAAHATAPRPNEHQSRPEAGGEHPDKPQAHKEPEHKEPDRR